MLLEGPGVHCDDQGVSRDEVILKSVDAEQEVAVGVSVRHGSAPRANGRWPVDAVVDWISYANESGAEQHEVPAGKSSRGLGASAAPTRPHGREWGPDDTGSGRVGGGADWR